MVLPGNAGSESSKGVDDDRPEKQHTALNGEDMMATIARQKLQQMSTQTAVMVLRAARWWTKVLVVCSCEGREI